MANENNIAFSATTPAAPSGSVLATPQQSTVSDLTMISFTVPAPVVVVGFVMTDGSTGINVGPILAAPHAGTITKCVVTTKASDATTDLTFTIKKNGTSVFTSSPTITHGTTSGTVSTFTTLTSSPLSVADGDLFTIDISSGASDWNFTAMLRT